MSFRQVCVERETKETRVRVALDLDGTGRASVRSGIGFLDHLLTALALHAGWDLELECTGDLEVDDHHTAEDCALCLGQALSGALGSRSGLQRFGWALVPMDEALARAAVDLSGRPWPAVDLGLARERIGALASENVDHVIRSLAVAMGAAVHVDVLRGANDHHRAEAAFKALALAVGQASSPSGLQRVASTKGVLT